MKRLLLFGIVLQMFLALNVYGANLDIRVGILFGASGVDVAGVLYDVAFRDGTLIELYDGADENTLFPFVNPSNPHDMSMFLNAYEALDAQVLIGEFDTTPKLVNGIGTDGYAEIWTPMATNGSAPTSSVGIAGWVNNTLGNNDYPFNGTTNRSFDTGWWNDNNMPGADRVVYAVWTQASVPIPGTIGLLGFGLLSLAGTTRRKKS